MTAVQSQVQQVTVWGVGVVSLAELDEVRAARQAAQGSADELSRQAAELQARIEDGLADAGALLVPRRHWWPVPPELIGHLVEADRLVARIARIDQTGRAPGWLARQRRARAAAQLRTILVEVARGGAEAGIEVPDVEPVLEEVAQLQGRLDQLAPVLEAATARLHQLGHEIQLREEAQRELGFDSLHLAAHLRAYGPPVAESPVELGPGEVAHLRVDAALGAPARMGAPAVREKGGAALAHTGIHHWIGSFRRGFALGAGAPPIDTGALLVTSERLLFAGSAGSVAVPLAGMLAVDVYDDGLAVFQLGREAADIFLVRDPSLVAFYANWISEKV